MRRQRGGEEKPPNPDRNERAAAPVPTQDDGDREPQRPWLVFDRSTSRDEWSIA